MLKKLFGSILTFCMLISCCIVVPASAAAELKIGAWVGAPPTDTELAKYQSLQQKKLDIVHQFINWSNNFDWVRPYADSVYKNGSGYKVLWQGNMVKTSS